MLLQMTSSQSRNRMDNLVLEQLVALPLLHTRQILVEAHIRARADDQALKNVVERENTWQHSNIAKCESIITTAMIGRYPESEYKANQIAVRVLQGLGHHGAHRVVDDCCHLHVDVLSMHITNQIMSQK